MGYIGKNNGTAAKISKLYLGNGLANSVVKAYVGDENGIARLWFSGDEPYIENGSGVYMGNYPTLKNSWGSVDPILAIAFDTINGTKVNNITEVEFMDIYTPTGKETSSQAIDVDETGAIMVYRLSNKLIIAGNGSGGIYANKYLSGLFLDFSSLKTIKGLSYLNTTFVEDMSSMFYNCKSLTKLDLTSFYTGKVKDMSIMFGGCERLRELNVSNWSTQSLYDIGYMFYGCKSLTQLDLRSFHFRDWGTLTEDPDMCFYGCSNLQSILVGHLWEVSLNMLNFMDCGTDHLTYPEINSPYPMLAKEKEWFKATEYNYIRNITFVTNYVPTGEEVASWAADVNGTGSIMCYQIDDGYSVDIIVSSCGAGKILAHPNSTWAFSFGCIINNADLLALDYVEEAEGMFKNATLNGADITNWNTSNIRYAHDMFFQVYCDALNINNWDTSNMIDMSSMFGQVQTDDNGKLDLSNWDTSNVRDMGSMFFKCKWAELDLRSWDTRKVYDASIMFRDADCYTILVGEKWDLNNANTHIMFYNCGTDKVTYV